MVDFKRGEHGYDVEAYYKAEEKFRAELAAWCRARRPGDDLAGETIRFPRGDGYAVYVVASSKPLALVHVPVGDAWAIPNAHARGLRLADVAELVRRRKSLEALFRKTASNDPSTGPGC